MRWAAVLALALGLALAGCGGARAVGSAAAVSGSGAAPARPSGPSSSSAPGSTGASIRLNPAAGGPGTTVTVTGHLPGVTAAQPPQGQWQAGSICWDGCRQGLVMHPTWTWPAQQPGTFTATFTVPAAAWLTAGGPHALSSGDYTVGIRCVGPAAPGCGLRGAQAVATFRLTAPPPARCAPDQACARLSLDPPAASPGETVRVTGWAPLTPMFGAAPSGYTLVLSPGNQLVGQVSQTAMGDLTGSFTVPGVLAPSGELLQPGPHTLSLRASFGVGTVVDLAPTALPVTAPPAWASLGPVRPLWTRATRALAGARVAGPSLTGGPVAVCGSGGIRWSADGGATWSDVPTAGAVAASASAPFVFQQGGDARCEAALPDPAHAGAFYVTFDLVATSCSCAPPYVPVGYYTSDGGRTWRAVPPPQGYTQGDFGGFQVDGQAVQALFTRRAGGAQAPAVAVQQTVDGGRTWRAAPLGCPGSGPCVRWGPRPTAIYACMAEQGRNVLGSDDGGRTWTVRMLFDLCRGAGQIAATGPTSLLAISGRGAFPVQASGDAGRTWRAIELPALPPPAATHSPGQYPELTLLPDGTLAVPDGTALMLLAPGASAWCPAAGVAVPPGATGFAVAGGRLWWTLTPTPSGTAMAASPGGVPLAGLRCAG